MIRAVILLVLAACASSKSAEQHAEVAAETQAAEKAETHAELHGTAQTFRHSIRVAERFTADGGVAARVVTDTSTGTDRSYVASADGTSGAESQTSLKAASEAHSASKWRVGLPWLSLAALAVGLALAWKTGWLGKGLSLLGRIF